MNADKTANPEKQAGSDGGSFQVYEEYAKALRTWFVAYGALGDEHVLGLGVVPLKPAERAKLWAWRRNRMTR